MMGWVVVLIIILALLAIWTEKCESERIIREEQEAASAALRAQQEQITQLRAEVYRSGQVPLTLLHQVCEAEKTSRTIVSHWTRRMLGPVGRRK